MDRRVSETSSVQGERLSGEWTRYKLQEPVAQTGIVRLWYRLTMPADLPGTNNARREVIRRTRIASILMFFLLLLLVTLVLPMAILVEDRVVLLLTCLLLSVVLVAILFNRSGRFHSAGAIVACGLSGVFYTSILTNSAGLTIDSLLLFNGLGVAEIFIASLLPGGWIFLATLVNSLFIVTTLMMLPETAELAQVMQTNSYVVILCLVVLHIIISGTVWLWVHNTTQANERADYAEEIATLQHTVAEQEHVVALQKQKLDNSIGHIMCTHVQIANGNLTARVPLQEVTTLQPLAVALNNLLNRLQRLRQIEQEFLSILPHLQQGKQAEYELQCTKYELQLLLHAIHESRQFNRCIRIAQNGTVLAPLFKELNGQSIALPPLHGKNTTTQLPAPDSLVSDQVV